MKVTVCTPTRAKPSQPYLDSLAASVPVTEAGGWEVTTVYEVGSPYISHARSKALHKALMAGADAVIFIDDDLSWQPDALLQLLDVGDPVVAGTYRFKRDPEEYMGAVMSNDDGTPKQTAGFLEMFSIPAGFLKITREGVVRFIKAYPELCYGDCYTPHVDLFNHGAWGGVWWGEDYAFARRWREKCGTVWLIPDLQIDHHTATESFPGNFHNFLRAQPGGDLAKDG
jgi:glycosyltransferase involved in cell wall biosynthesis